MNSKFLQQNKILTHLTLEITGDMHLTTKCDNLKLEAMVTEIGVFYKIMLHIWLLWYN